MAKLVPKVVQGVLAALAAGGLNVSAAAAAGQTATVAAGGGVTCAAAVTAAAAAAPGSSTAAAAVASCGQQVTPEHKIGFPDLSRHGTVEDLARWYYIDALADTGKTAGGSRGS